jgi:hypothetical protein
MIKTAKWVAAVVLCSAVLLSGSTAQARRRPRTEIVDMHDLPAGIRKALDKEAGDSEILRVEREDAHGKTIYEALVNRDGREWNIAVDGTGNHVDLKNGSGKKTPKPGKTGKR